MAIVIDGSGTVTGLAVGGLPDGSVDADTLAANSVTAAKIVDGTIVDAEVTSLAASKLTGALPAISGANLTGIASVPSGVIAMWHGAAGAIPTGWVICDGTNSTPNLTDKFIKSAAAAGATGGSATTGAHTLSIAEMPAHTHNKNYLPGSAAAYVAAGRNNFFDPGSLTTSSTGGGGSHTHPQSEPIHFALIFIMKT